CGDGGVAALNKSAMHAETSGASALGGKALAEEAGIGDDRAGEDGAGCLLQATFLDEGWLWMKAGFGEAC
ncbi:hypothetical protein THAOC_20030, partial [Thalassiosira oceanica]